MSIKINNLSFKYKKNSINIFENINLSLKEGTINVLLGLNGCGKTTLLKNIASLLTPTEGNIEVDSINIEELSIREKSRKIAFVSQSISSNEDYKVEDYLTYGLVNSLKFYESPTKNHYEQVHNVASKLNINHLLNKSVGEISGGERQIVEIASAILQNTPYILLDEPTSALDMKNQSLVLDVLKDLCRKKDKTILLTTHNPNHALSLSANTYLMHKGKIYLEGDANNVVTKDNLFAIYGDKICLSSELPYKEISLK